METKVTSIPITIIDFMAIVLPGFVWLVLLTATFHFIRVHDLALDGVRIALDARIHEFGIFAIALYSLVLSLIIGNMFKPITMEAAEKVSVIFPLDTIFRFSARLRSEMKKIEELNRKNHEGKTAKEIRKIGTIKLNKLHFPFDDLHADTKYYLYLRERLADKLGCEPEALGGHKLFSTAKRYIRFISPTLWEESERMEAEVRLSGAMLLAAVYSLGLELTCLILHLFGITELSDLRMIYFAAAISLASSIILVVGWSRLRFKEVSYTYTNALIALNSTNSTIPEHHGVKNE